MRQISLRAFNKINTDIEILKADIILSDERLELARGKGDLSENEEYTTEKENNSSMTRKLQSLQLVLQTSQVKESYSTNISAGSLLSVKIVGVNGNVIRDLGLLMFDEVGDILFDGVINPTSPLGQAIDGKLGGIYQVQDMGGGMITYSVVLESEDKIDLFLANYSMPRKERLRAMFALDVHE